METITTPTGDTVIINEDAIEIDTAEADARIQITEDDKLAVIRGLLGDVPPLEERLGRPEDLATKSEGELRYMAAVAVEALEHRRAEMLRIAKEEEERERALRVEKRRRIRQINLLEKAYLATQTGRRAQSTQASQNIAEAMYNAGARVEDPEADTE